MLTLEYILVGLIVLGCGIFSIWRLLSARMRLRVLEGLGSWTGDPGNAAIANAAQAAGNSRLTLVSGWLWKLRGRTLRQLAVGCGTCGSAGQSHRRIPPTGG